MSGTNTKKGLSPRHQLFVQRYLIHRNGAQAAREAGYSVKTARHQASDLLANPDIAALVKRETEKAMDLLVRDKDAVIRRLGQIAFGDARRLFHEDDTPKLPHELDDDTAAIVGGVEHTRTVKVSRPANEVVGAGKAKKRQKVVSATTTTEVRYRKIDPVKALHLLGIHHQVFKDQPTVNQFVQFIIQE